MVPDQFSHLLEEIHKLETELGHLPQKWKVLWDKLELPNTDSLAVSHRIFVQEILYVKLFSRIFEILLESEFIQYNFNYCKTIVKYNKIFLFF